MRTRLVYPVDVVRIVLVGLGLAVGGAGCLAIAALLIVGAVVLVPVALIGWAATDRGGLWTGD